MEPMGGTLAHNYYDLINGDDAFQTFKWHCSGALNHNKNTILVLPPDPPSFCDKFSTN